MSTNSSVGFDMLSKNTALVPGCTAAFHCARSAPSTNVTFTPNRVSTSSSTYRHDPNSARDDTTWSPARNIEVSAPLTAAMPLAVAKASSVPSRPAMRSSNIRVVGLP